MEECIHVTVSRSKLESYSTGELIKLADSFGIDIPHGLERIFIIEELLEYSDMDALEEGEDIEIDLSYPETAALPKQYNISYINVLIRDPLWVFVYWEIKNHDRELHENLNDFKGYFLRLIPINGEEKDSKSKEDSFTVPVDINDCARYIGLAEHSPQTQGRYIIKLGVTCGNSEIQIAASQPFCMPKLIENVNINNMKENPLLRLSAVEDLSIIKNIDRQSRIKRQ
jgi:hypothetical protein